MEHTNGHLIIHPTQWKELSIILVPNVLDFLTDEALVAVNATMSGTVWVWNVECHVVRGRLGGFDGLDFFHIISTIPAFIFLLKLKTKTFVETSFLSPLSRFSCLDKDLIGLV